jgi:hypothetical protein
MNAQKHRTDKTVTPSYPKESITLPATVDELIPAEHAGELDQACISLDGEREPYNEIRVENPLHSSSGGTVTLAKGDHVRLSVGNSCEGSGEDKADRSRAKSE